MKSTGTLLALLCVLGVCDRAQAVDFNSKIIPNDTLLINIRGDVQFEFTRTTVVPVNGRTFGVIPGGHFFGYSCELTVENSDRISHISAGTVFQSRGDYGHGAQLIEDHFDRRMPSLFLLTTAYRGAPCVRESGLEGTSILSIQCGTPDPDEFLRTVTVGNLRRGLDFAFFLRGEVEPAINFVR